MRTPLGIRTKGRRKRIRQSTGVTEDNYGSLSSLLLLETRQSERFITAGFWLLQFGMWVAFLLVIRGYWSVSCWVAFALVWYLFSNLACKAVLRSVWRHQPVAAILEEKLTGAYVDELIGLLSHPQQCIRDAASGKLADENTRIRVAPQSIKANIQSLYSLPLQPIVWKRAPRKGVQQDRLNKVQLRVARVISEITPDNELAAIEATVAAAINERIQRNIDADIVEVLTMAHTILRQRLARQTHTEGLLRAATGPQAEASTLMRATHSEDKPEECLLRASSEDY